MTEDVSAENEAAPLPSLAAPRPSGVIRGLGETFDVAAATGTGSFAIPLQTPAARGVELGLSLRYDSGAGNGPFGLGFSLSVPSISRRTDRGVPSYSDTDVFLLAGAEDLVRVPWENADGTTAEAGAVVIGGVAHTGHQFRPRTEGLFARIERLVRADGDVHWRVITRDNVRQTFGRDPRARVADPLLPQRVFSWLLEESRDDRGNVVRYRYKQEDGRGVDVVAEAHRFANGAFTATAQQYLKRIQYGNRTAALGDDAVVDADDDWCFEVVFDYGDHDAGDPRPRDDESLARAPWPARRDAFSQWRATFEVRTLRLCRRVLTYHRFPDLGGARLVRSTRLDYDENVFATLLTSVAVTGHDGVASAALPPVQLGYQAFVFDHTVRPVDQESLDGLEGGLAGGARFVDLDGDGAPGVLIPHEHGWLYKRNEGGGDLGPALAERSLPRPGDLTARQQLLDVGGDGNLDVVSLDPSLPGFFERVSSRGTGRFDAFRPFRSTPRIDATGANVRFLDVDGDGFADLVVAEDDAWLVFPARGKDGFGAPVRWPAPRDDGGSVVVFASGDESIHLADLTGDGLADVVRVRASEVCYWPSRGNGFAGKVVLGGRPLFDSIDQFDPRRVRWADVDGTGATDLLYLGRDGIRLYRNQAGNALAPALLLPSLPPADDATSVEVVDLLGQGTACLVWSSPAPVRQPRPLAYVDLTGGHRPFLLSSIENNLGAETRVRYASSTTFAMADRRAGRPWITRLPFPVHVVAEVETWDHIQKNRFCTRYAYHHGFYDGIEREFRGFGMVEQWDTAELDTFRGATNGNPATHVPPAHTKTWFHTGAWFGREHVSDYFAGLLDGDDVGEYWRPPGLDDAAARALLLDDTVLPEGLTIAEEREVCRALRGMTLRQEVYGLDETPQASHPYSVVERNFAARLVQAKGANAHAVVFVHPREELTTAYERRIADPRITHHLTLEVDAFGTVLKTLSVAYGRTADDPNLPLDDDRATQRRTWLRLDETEVTNPVRGAGRWRAPVPCATTSWDLTGYGGSGPAGRFAAGDVVEADPTRPGRLRALADDTLAPEEVPAHGRRARRRLSGRRTLFRADDLTALLPLGALESRALSGEQLALAFTGGLLGSTFRRGNVDLLPNAAAVLASTAADGGGYRHAQALKAAGLFPASDDDDDFWRPTGRVFLSPDAADSPAQELAYARAHFFTPRRSLDAFANQHSVRLDAFDLLPEGTTDAAGNTVTAHNDYRVLLPASITDENGTTRSTAFDALGLVAGTAVTAPGGDGDTLAGFLANLPAALVQAQIADPLADPSAILQGASTRVVHDLFAYVRTKNAAQPSPTVLYTLTREVHHHAVIAGDANAFRHTLAFSDGFGRVVQTKRRAADGAVVEDGPVGPRFVTSGWEVCNNKGLVIHRFEPFFTDRVDFERDARHGVSPVFFYDPLGRPIATLYPDGTFDKVVFSPWQEVRWDKNDASLLDPHTDVDVGGAVHGWLAARGAGFRTWITRRASGGPLDQEAAQKTAAHAATPKTTVLDALGRPALTLDHRGFDAAARPLLLASRVTLDLLGNQREVRDAVVDGDPRGRLIRRLTFDLTGARLRQESLDAGSRWMLPDAAARPLRAWDSAGRAFRMTYDALRRPLHTFLDEGTGEVLYERLVYGEQLAAGAARGLRGRVFLQLDQSGALSTSSYDFKGNRTGDVRRLARNYRSNVDWSAVEAALAVVPLDEGALEDALAPRLELERFARSVRYDALDRAVQLIAPHSDRAGAVIDVVQPSFDRGGLLRRVDAWHGQAQVPPGMIDAAVEPPAPAGIDGVDYDAHGRRVRVDWKNGARTTWHYDDESLRLTRVYTRRAGDPADPAPGTFAGVQHLRYSYDAVGNVLAVDDDAQQAVFFDNARVDPSARYRYDALYRLIEATGREHLGQIGGVPRPSAYNDAPRVGLPHRNDAQALGRYTERYDWDDAGGLRELTHRGANTTWIRRFACDEPSLLQPLQRGDRLSRAVVGVDADVVSNNGDGYDACGNPRKLAHLAEMTWDARGQLRSSRRQAVDPQDVEGQQRQGETTWYVYDASGTRIRVVTERGNGTRKDERLALGGFDVYRRYGANPLERETLHLLDGDRRLAQLHRRVSGIEAGVPANVVRQVLGNHLGSACVELDDAGAIVSYEEYTPFGSTAYRGVASQVEVPNRYRYAGKERDEETGFIYYGSRYYVPWLGRFLSPDKAGIEGGLNLYAFVRGNPVTLEDPDGGRPRLTTWLLTGGDKWEATSSELAYITSDMRRSDVWFNSAAGYGALVGVVSVFENTFLLGYDLGLGAQDYVTPDNSFMALHSALNEKGLGAVLREGFVTQMTEAFEGDAVAFGAFTFGLYTAVEGSTNTNLKIPMPKVSFDPAMAIAGGGSLGGGFSATLVETQVGALVGGGPPLIVMMMEAKGDGSGTEGEKKKPPGEKPGPTPPDKTAGSLTPGKNFKDHFISKRPVIEKALDVKLGKLSEGGGEALLKKLGEGIDSGMFKYIGEGTLKKGQEAMHIYRGNGLTIVTKGAGEWVTALTTGEGMDLAIAMVP